MKSKPVRVSDWLAGARRMLSVLPANDGGRSAQEASLETQVLLAHTLDKPRAWVLAHPDVVLADHQQRLLDGLLAGLARGAPLPYLTGHQEFFGLDFEVSPAVLIPRPETELLVERALEWLRKFPHRRRAADVGTGSGCIAVSLAHDIPRLQLLAADRSWEALQIARRNALRSGVLAQMTFVQSDLLTAIPGPFDLVCANLPYIPSGALETLPVAHYEPRLALDGGPDGLQAIRDLLTDAPRWLEPGGLLLLEMQYDQGEPIAALARAVLPGARVAVINDLAGLPRLVEIERG